MKIVQEPTRSDMCCHQLTFRTGNRDFHWHEHYEFCQILKNPCRFLVNGQLIQAQEGDIIAIAEQTVHRFLVDHDDTLVRIVQFPVRILLPTTASIKPLKTHITLAEQNANPQLKERLDCLFRIMDREYQVPLAESNPFLQSLCAAVYFLLMRHFATEETSVSSGNERREFYKVVEFANQHYTSNINIQIIASQLYSSRGRLARLFRKYSGMDLNEYINSLRIKHANQLLLQGYRITEAATESGFQSIRTFNNIYRAQMGITPSEYVRTMREQ